MRGAVSSRSAPGTRCRSVFKSSRPLICREADMGLLPERRRRKPGGARGLGLAGGQLVADHLKLHSALLAVVHALHFEGAIAKQNPRVRRELRVIAAAEQMGRRRI